MGFNLFNPLAIGNTVDITRIDETPIYKLGQRVLFTDTTVRNPNIIGDFAYIFALVDVIQFQPYLLDESQNINQEVRTRTPTTQVAFANAEIAIAQQDSLDSNNPTVSIPAGFYGFVLCKGNGFGLIDADDKIDGTFLRLAISGTSLITTTAKPQVSAISTAISTSSLVLPILLLGKKVPIQA